MRLVNRDGKLKFVWGEKNSAPERIATARVPTDTEFYAGQISKHISEAVERIKPSHSSLIASVIILAAVVVPVTNQITESLATSSAGTASASTTKTIAGMIPMLLSLAVLVTVVNFAFNNRI